MEHTQNRANHMRETQKRWFRQVIDHAVKTGQIQQHELDFWMRQLKVDPETIPKVYDQLQKMGVWVIPPEPEPDFTPQERQIIRELLEQYGQELSGREHRLFTLRYLDGRTAAEIAEQEGLTRARVCQLNNKVIRKLARGAGLPRNSKKIRDFCD